MHHAVSVGEPRTPDIVIGCIVELCNKIIDQGRSTGINVLAMGMGAPGPLRLPAGIVASSPHFPDWHEVPLADELSRQLKIEVYLDNDANAAAFTEYWIGKGKEYDHLVLFTLGTGLGSGIILDNRVWHGVDGSGGEAGHMVIDVNGPPCNCGNNGCLETFVSGTAIVSRYTRDLQVSTDPAHFTVPPHSITAEHIFRLAQQGDSYAKKILHETGSYLGIGVANLVNILNIKLFLISGGLSGAHAYLLDPAREEAQNRAFPSSMENVRIELAEFTQHAGVIGAGGLAFRALGMV
jgi:glucokinase